MCGALTPYQTQLAEELTRPHPPQPGHLAVGLLEQSVCGPVEDQIQRLRRLSLLDHADAGGKPLHSHVVPGQPHRGRLTREQCDRL